MSSIQTSKVDPEAKPKSPPVTFVCSKRAVVPQPAWRRTDQGTAYIFHAPVTATTQPYESSQLRVQVPPCMTAVMAGMVTATRICPVPLAQNETPSYPDASNGRLPVNENPMPA